MKFKKLIVVSGFVCALASVGVAESSNPMAVILSSPEFPDPEVMNAGIRDINRINAVHSDGYRIRSLNEEQKVITTVPAAIWRGDVCPQRPAC